MTAGTIENRGESRLRVAVAGAGGMARHHLDAIRRCTDSAQVVAVADPSDAARNDLLESRNDVLGFGSLEMLLEETSPDVVHICTPPSTHVELALEALQARSHVYVEKPFAPTREEARKILNAAEQKGRQVCAGHQLLFQRPMRELMGLLPAIGPVVDVESFFSFRPSRGRADGSAALRADQQLRDVLPHPVYLLIAVLEEAGESDARLALRASLEGPGATVHALVGKGSVNGSLVVTLTGRPVESYLRVVGENGRLQADFVRGTLQHLVGPGSSGIDKALNPFRTARQLTTGTAAALARRVLKREKSYPGLLEILDAFYGSILNGSEPPLSRESLLATVGICEELGTSFATTQSTPQSSNDKRAPHSHAHGPVLVTGGTGFLGMEVVRALLASGYAARVLARREPAPWERLQDVEYVTADLAAGLDPNLVSGCEAIVHCAAETRGGWAAHERNSIKATENVLRTAAAAGGPPVIHVSSVAVLEPGSEQPIDENTPLLSNPRASGPYAWGKAESERRASELAEQLGVPLKIVRPGALVDYRRFEPPGRLGRRLGNFFVAVGAPSETLEAVDVRLAGQVLAWLATHFEQGPDILHILDPDPPGRRELLQHLRRRNPDVRVIRIPRFLLSPLSWLAVAVQKMLRPAQPAIHLSRVFRHLQYDRSRIASLERRVPESPDKAMATGGS